MNALAGLRVVDLSQTRTGAQATQVLADFGADVEWIEPPGGSRLREQRAFPFYARGKQSVVLDLKDAADRETAVSLAVDADVLVESFRPGIADRLGLGPDVLCERNPRLVYTSITGFGRIGPYAGIKGYEGLVQAKLGVFKAFERMADADHPPFVTVPWCSFAATQTALQGILAALIERERSGLGQHVEANLAQGFAALDTWDWFLDLVTQRYPDAFRPSDAFAAGVPASPLVYMLLVGLTKDGRWLQFAQVAPRLFVALMKALDLDWMFTDPEWQGIPLFEDARRRGALLDRMHEAVARKTLAEWQAVFEADPDVFAEIYRSGPEVLDHPALRVGGHVVAVDDPERGQVRQPAAFADFDRTPALVTRPAPSLGQRNPRDPVPAPTTAVEARSEGSTAGPLEGVTVIELAVMFAAPFGATLLTDLGARVIKIEPITGDPIRTIMPFPESGGAKAMQGKDSICVDITTPEGRQIVHQLAARCDLVLEGFRSGVAERLRVDADTLLAINPNLVYVSASGYGRGGPAGHRPAFAPSIGAASGIARANLGATVREEPNLSLPEIRASAIRLFSGSAIVQAQADGFAALGVATALLLGLLARERGAGGQRVASSMLSTAAHAMADQIVDVELAPPARADCDDMRGPHALYRIYDAADGWIFLAAPAPSEWPELVKALASHVDLGSDERFATDTSRREHDDALTAALTEVFARRPKDEWERDLLAADVGCVAVTTDRIERVLQSEQVGRASGYVVDVEHPTFDVHPRLAPLIRFSRSATHAKAGVLAGSATDAVLRELGYESAAIADLRTRLVVG
ncbi:MAG: CaiB/BaiF CoA transferase family protein [Acidimicrobiales bacterium]